LRGRERDYVWGGRGKRQRKESQADSPWSAEPEMGLDLRTLRS